MGHVNVQVNGRSYRVACEDGQEDRIARLAGEVDVRIKEMVETVGQVGDNRLLVMASLLIADELDDLRTDFDGAQTDVEQTRAAGFALSTALNSLAERIETLAARLEAS